VRGQDALATAGKMPALQCRHGTGATKKVSEHGGFANDDRNVLLIVSNLNYSPSTYTGAVETRQVAPTVLQALGYDPSALQAVQKEGTEVLPGLPFTGAKK